MNGLVGYGVPLAERVRLLDGALNWRLVLHVERDPQRQGRLCVTAPLPAAVEDDGDITVHPPLGAGR